MLFVLEKTTFSKVMGGIEIVESVFEMATHVAILVWDLVTTEDKEYNVGISVWMCARTSSARPAWPGGRHAPDGRIPRGRPRSASWLRPASWAPGVEHPPDRRHDR